MANTRRTTPALQGDASRPDVVPITIVADEGERKAQAAIEGTPATDTVEFSGERYALAAKVGYLPLLKFAHAASQGTDSASMEGMAAMYDMLRGCFYRGEPCGKCDLCTGDEGADPPRAADPGGCLVRDGDEWRRFEQHAMRISADDEELFAVVSSVIETVAARPTRRRSGSSPPARTTSPSSRAGPHMPPQADGLVPVTELAR